MELQSSRIPEPRQDKLQSWLKDIQLDVLVEVIESRILQHEVEAANCLVNCVSDTIERPGYEAEAKNHAEKAVFLKRFIETLIEFRDNKSPLTTSTVTPTKRK